MDIAHGVLLIYTENQQANHTPALNAGAKRRTMKSFDERLREHLLNSDTPSKLSFEEGAYWSERQHEKWCLGAWITGIMGGIVLTFMGLFFYNVYQANPQTCTCRFAQHRVHFGDQYTKTNKRCIDLGNGSVQAGDTVYLDVKWFSNECE